MLREECESFSSNEDDIGCIPDLEMDINLKDNQPVQKKYTSIPRPLYPEVKQYIEDLLNQNFITESKSPYSSPVVCVWKKDGSLRLCIDYRELNRRTIADRHPIPRVQETLDSLGCRVFTDLTNYEDHNKTTTAFPESNTCNLNLHIVTRMLAIYTTGSGEGRTTLTNTTFLPSLNYLSG